MPGRSPRSAQPSATASHSRAVRFAAITSATGTGSLRRSSRRTARPDVVRARVAIRLLDGGAVGVDAEHRVEPELRRGDRQHARAAAEVA